jgi:glycosyltransferase involved in cell wall biosynthesis
MYNVKNYIERCIRSLEDQDLPENEYEIICINDGSPDDSRGVVIQCQKEFDNIVLIDQENQGVSKARNNGIDKARGRYILMIDPDDYLERQVLRKTLEFSKVKDLDLAIFGYRIFNIDGKIIYNFLPEFNNNRVISGIALFDEIFRGKPNNLDPDRSVGIIFKTSFMRGFNLFYLLNVPYLEDGELLARIFCLAERAGFNKLIIYNRTTRPGSATNSKLFHSRIAIDGFIKCAMNLRNFRDNFLITQAQKTFLNQPIAKFSILAIASCSSLNSLKSFSYVKRELVKNHLNKLILTTCNRQYTRLGSVYNFSIDLFLIYYAIWQKIIVIRYFALKVKKGINNIFFMNLS